MSGDADSRLLLEILDAVKHCGRRLDAIEGTVGPIARIAVRADSRKEQARKAGVHPSTLWRREKREKQRLLVERSFKKY